MQLKYTTKEGQTEYAIPVGFKIGEVVVTEKKEVGIEHVSDPGKVDFVFSYHEGTLKPTRFIKEGSEITVSAASA